MPWSHKKESTTIEIWKIKKMFCLGVLTACLTLLGFTFAASNQFFSLRDQIEAENKNFLKFSPTNPDSKYGISLWDGRIVVVPPKDSDLVKSDKSFNLCVTSSSEVGFCSRLSECKGFSITSLHNNICFLDMFIPGVCCPQRLLNPSIFDITTKPTITTPKATTEVAVTEKTILSQTENKENATQITLTNGTPDCGVHTTPSSRIVHGKTSNDGKWPWMAALFANTFLGKKFHCGGSLISTRHVLSGAHCVTDQRGVTFSPLQISVRLGDNDISSLRDKIGRFYSVKEIRGHPEFQNINHYFLNDVAVIKLEDEVRLNDFVFPICLPSPAIDKAPLDIFAGRYSTVTGFGRTELGTPSKTLLEARVPIWKNADCDGAYFAPITDIFICAGYRSGGIDACQGDSGGPLQVEEDNRWTQIGITSFGKGCGEPGFPGVYTRVSKFLKWIKKNML